MTPLPLPMRPADDLRLALEAAVHAAGCSAAFIVAGIGSIGTTRLRFASADNALAIDDVESVAMSGTVARKADDR